jgi:prephenate dehydratase
MAGAVAFQGAPGANSDLACREVFPERPTLPSVGFEDAIAAVQQGRADLAMLPIENSVAGRVADVYHLLPRSDLHIVAEHFAPVHHQLMSVAGASLAGIRTIRSHIHALGQCRKLIRSLGVSAEVAADTAGAAAELAARPDPSIGVLAPTLAAEIYGLEVLEPNVEDETHNTTRFVVVARQPSVPSETGLTVTTLVFRVRNVPAALYKALGGFATNSINMTKLESYMVGGSFSATEFYADVEAHPAERRLQLALEELGFFTEEMKILGSYPGHAFRRGQTLI